MSRVVLFLALIAATTAAVVRQTAKPNTEPTDLVPSNTSNTPDDVSLQVVSAMVKLMSILPIKDKLVTALSVPMARAYDTLRPGLKAVGIAYLAYQAMTYLLPSMTNGWTEMATARGSPTTTENQSGTSKSLSEAIGELGVSAMARSLQSLNFTPRSTAILSTWEHECKRRAACELGKSVAESIPYIAWILGYFGSKFPIIGQFADAFSEGLNRPDCSLLYQECPYLRPSANP